MRTLSRQISHGAWHKQRHGLCLCQTAPLGDWLPSVTDTRFATGTPEPSSNLLSSCEGFYNSPLGDGSGFITLLSLSLDDDTTLNSSTIVARPGAVYASADSLYVAMRQSSDSGYGWYSGMEGQPQVITFLRGAVLSPISGNRRRWTTVDRTSARFSP